MPHIEQRRVNATVPDTITTIELDSAELTSVVEAIRFCLNIPIDEQPDFCDQYLMSVLSATNELVPE